MHIIGALKRGILLHLPFPFVLLIKFIGKVSFVVFNSALLLAANR
jgi:hypothetical protein